MTFAIILAFIHVVLFLLTGDDNYFITSQVWCAASLVCGSLIGRLS